MWALRVHTAFENPWRRNLLIAVLHWKPHKAPGIYINRNIHSLWNQRKSNKFVHASLDGPEVARDGHNKSDHQA